MSQKFKTNEQLILAFLKDLHTVEAALLRERLQLISALTRESIAENPKPFRTLWTHETDWLRLCDKIDKHLGSEETIKISTNEPNKIS